MSLRARLIAEIAQAGPITVADYMARCLHDPLDGYYATRPALGAGGDFITAPLVSQMFGELIGLWAVETWRRLGRPAPFQLVEVGPGDGTLMADALRAARLAPDFLEAAALVLVEPSAPLRALQGERLAAQPLAVRSLTDIAELKSDSPALLIANEVLDCLPARQFVRTGSGWVERRVGLDDSGDLAFGLTPAPAGFAPPCEAGVGEVVEVSPAQEAFARQVATLVVEGGGAALLIDYGRDSSGPGDTLQALRRHARVDPLATPGEADLTVWADFPAVIASARAAGAATAGPLTQGDLLRRLGMEARAAALAAAAPDRSAQIARQLARLTDSEQMGRLFKAVCLYRAGDPVPAGFEEAS